jgi:type I restriction-modification system DNA methylase subunit
MYQNLFTSLKEYYEKFLQRGASYGLSYHDIHENSLKLFSNFLGLVILWQVINPNTLNNHWNPRKIRMIIHKFLFDRDIESIPTVLKDILGNPTHIEIQLKDALTLDEWENLIEILLNIKWNLTEDFRDDSSKNQTVMSPEFLSYFYEAVLNDYEKLFSIKSIPKLSKRKNKGIFFTPWKIVKQITDKCYNEYEVSFNKKAKDDMPIIKILDPSCGTGSFLIYSTESLYQRLISSFPNPSSLAQWIIEHCIYGVDLASSALTIVKLRLLCWYISKAKCDIEKIPVLFFNNIQLGNSLFGHCKEKIQYPLDYKLRISRIMDNLGLKSAEKYKLSSLSQKNWWIISNHLKLLRRNKVKFNFDEEIYINSEMNLKFLVTTFFKNLIKRKARKSKKSTPFKDKKLDEINLFHWGLVFPEVMLRGGFDIVIGNPPYGRSVLSPREKTLIKLLFRSCSGQQKKYSLNAASAFIERSISLLKPNGIAGLIVPFSILRVEEFESLRDLILEKTKILAIFDESTAFHEVTLEMCSIFMKKQKISKHNISVTPRSKVSAEPEVSVSVFKKYKRFMIYYDRLWEKTAAFPNGIVKGDYGIDHRIVGKDLNSSYSSKYHIPFLHSGRTVTQYGLNPKYFHWSKAHPSNVRFTTYYHTPRLVNTAIGNQFRVAYKPEKIIPGTNVSILEIPSSYHFFPMLILLNSDVINYLLKRYILNFSHLTVYLHKYYTNLLPIKYPKDNEKEYSILASYLLFLHQSYHYNQIKFDKRFEYFKNLANYLVFDLYYPEILKLSSPLPVLIRSKLVPIDTDTYLNLIFEIKKTDSEVEMLNRIIISYKKTIFSVANRLRDDEELHGFKKIIYNHPIARQIRKEL